MRGSFKEMLIPAEPGASARAARVAQRVQAFVPAPLAGIELALSGSQAADVADAEAALARLQAASSATPLLDAAAWRLLRAEAVASSQIEAVDITHRRLARVEAGALGRRYAQAAEAQGNVAAMRLAVEGATAGIVVVDDLLAFHSALMQGSTRRLDRELAGAFRDRPVWIGGASVRSAQYVAPPHEDVPGLVDDLVRFVQERRDLSPVVVAAIAHAQFETIHPFHDGNGRVGRCLIHATLRASGATGAAVVPVSLALRADTPAYITGLVAFREGDVEGWVAQFANAVSAAAAAAVELADGLLRLRAQWRSQVVSLRAAQHGRAPRQDSAVMRMLDELAAAPVLNVAMVAARLAVSKEAANNAVALLHEAGVLQQVSAGKRNRLYEAREVFELLSAVEIGLGAAGPV